MEVIEQISLLRNRLAAYRQEHKQTQIGYVPTMGYLHDGHASLLRRAKEQTGLVVLSIFVNPLQFGPNEDFEKYPRDTERDLQLAEAAGVDIVFLPSVAEMYPKPTQTTVSVKGITSRLCGASRPGHFDGVATVVSKLFNIVQPDKAFFGLKDAQQIAVITQMVEDLNMPVEIVPCPTLREADGLALSSRNVYLSAEERSQAVVLSQSLAAAEAFISEHQHFTSEELVEAVKVHIRKATLGEIDYVEALAFPSLEPFTSIDTVTEKRIIVALAVKFSKARLIDNQIFPIRK
ncbi:pantoate--beta-alanine ligase [Paenibacillus eucommiae]|uniref:Pantothenate synthetase n=1 Tax=Paenibacillus eucommiae TaxID=1355755 RepID=A0ABS4J4J6_9BACL|nr:pantoate--beta-alanine ligase [Paenibacillus eucommiae]MBP1994767.1 pantoate--beta-alanine ligase [Paenibacillus eucommiae]